MQAVFSRNNTFSVAESRLLPCVQAARAASSAAIAAQQQAQQQEAREPLPAFGSGIQFRPTKKVKQQGSSQASQKSAAVPHIHGEMDAADEMDDEMEDADVQPVSKPRVVSLGVCWLSDLLSYVCPMQQAGPPFTLSFSVSFCPLIPHPSSYDCSNAATSFRSQHCPRMVVQSRKLYDHTGLLCHADSWVYQPAMTA